MATSSASRASVNGRIVISAARNPGTFLTNCVRNVTIKEDREEDHQIVVAPTGSAVCLDVPPFQYQVRTHRTICTLVVDLASAVFECTVRMLMYYIKSYVYIQQE